MLSFWTTRRNRAPIIDTLAATRGSRVERASLLYCYEDWIGRDPAHWTPLPHGLHVFTDIEYLAGESARRAAALRGFLGRRGRVLNHPIDSLRRLPLHRALYTAGINRFRSFPVNDFELGQLRFPVFVRRANDHQGSRSELLTTPAALNQQLAAFRQRHKTMTDWIVTEYVETADTDGLRHKYAAFAIDGTIVPRHLFFSSHWMIKEADRLSPLLLERERAYLHANPHREELQRIFKLACIDYGRIDYSVVDKRLQVWEINTNPQVLRPGHGSGPRTVHHRWFEGQLEHAWEHLDALTPVAARLRHRQRRLVAAMLMSIGRDAAKRALGKRAVLFLARCRQWVRDVMARS